MASSRKRQCADLGAHLSTFLSQHHQPGQELVLGLSGGLDSRVLLHLLVHIRDQGALQFSAVHIHHGISPYASDWAAFCADLCERDKVQFQAVMVDVPRDSGLGIEAAAREARYRVLLSHPANTIILAHHEDDQAETILLQLMRGAGVKGLAAMGAVSDRKVSDTGRYKKIFRPLLNVSRSALLSYATTHELDWIDDESNLDLAYDRNFLRHHILPQLDQRFSASRRTLARSASHMAEAAQLLEELAQEDAARAVKEGALEIALLKTMSSARATNLLRYWLAEQGGVQLSSARIEDIRSQLLNAKPDARISINLGGRQLKRRRNFAYIESMPESDQE